MNIDASGALGLVLAYTRSLIFMVPSHRSYTKTGAIQGCVVPQQPAPPGGSQSRPANNKINSFAKNKCNLSDMFIYKSFIYKSLIRLIISILSAGFSSGSPIIDIWLSYVLTT